LVGELSSHISIVVNLVLSLRRPTCVALSRRNAKRKSAMAGTAVTACRLCSEVHKPIYTRRRRTH